MTSRSATRGNGQLTGSHYGRDTQPDLLNSSDPVTRLDLFLIGSAVAFVSVGPIATAIAYAVYIIRYRYS